ncbi:hypothetical protein [Sphaerisporangium melleum]|uniref:hypothetical protein n=1 Tax=Sphaerisporangium melleum TaxID=321316 RepID=UPI001669F678|nr:hypothetical protein [Sphaerisporangium melleum]
MPAMVTLAPKATVVTMAIRMAADFRFFVISAALLSGSGSLPGAVSLLAITKV